ncbi:MAG: hypothetical protein R3C10_06620 [Pirellulales bacterium]
MRRTSPSLWVSAQQQEAERDDELRANPQIAITRDELWHRVGKTDG